MKRHKHYQYIRAWADGWNIQRARADHKIENRKSEKGKKT